MVLCKRPNLNKCLKPLINIRNGSLLEISILLSIHLSPCLCVYFSAHAHRALPGFGLTFFYNSCWRHRGNFWLHLHVKWSMLLCGCEVPPDSPSPVARQTELQLPSSPSFPPSAGMGHDSHNILRCCQSFHCSTGVNLLKSSRLARTNMTHAEGLPTAWLTKGMKKTLKGSHSAAVSYSAIAILPPL